MNRIIAKAFLCLLLLPMMAAGQNTNTNTVNVTYTFTDFNLTPQAVRRATQTPLAPFADFNGSILTASPIAKVTGGAGSVTFSNTAAGYSYRIQLDTPFGSTVRTSGFPAILTGNVNGRDYLGEIRGQNFYYLYPNNTTLLISNALNSVGFNPANFIASANGTGAGTTTFTNGAGAQIQLQNGGTSGTLTLDPSGITASAPVNSQTINGTFGNFTSVQGGFFHGDGSGLTNLQVPVGVVTVTNAIANNNGTGTNPTFVGVTTFPVGAVLNAQNAPILATNMLVTGPILANAGISTTSIGATSVTTGDIQSSTGEFNGNVTVLGNFHAPSNSITYGTNFTISGLNLIRGRMNGDTISPYTPLSSAPGWSFAVNGSRVLDMTDPGHGGVTFNVPVNGQFVGGFTGGGNPGDFTGNGSALTSLGASNLTGNVQVVGLTNALGQMIVGSGSITVTPSGNSIVIGGGGSGPGGSATNAIGNNGGSGTNTFLYTQTTFHGLISGDATGTLLGVTAGASTNLASLGPITNQVLGSKVVGQVAGATNAVNATNLIGTLAATQLTGNVPLPQLTNSGLVTAGLNTTLSTNSNGSYAINAAAGTNGLLVPTGMTDYVSSAGYTLSNTVTASYSTVDTNNNSYHSGNATIGGTYFGNASGMTNTATDNVVYLFTNKTAVFKGQLYSFPSSTTAGLQEIQQQLPPNVNATGPAGISIRLADGSTYPFSSPIYLTNNVTIIGGGPWSSGFVYVGPTNVFTSNSVVTSGYANGLINTVTNLNASVAGGNPGYLGNYSFQDFFIKISTNFPCYLLATLNFNMEIKRCGFFNSDVLSPNGSKFGSMSILDNLTYGTNSMVLGVWAQSYSNFRFTDNYLIGLAGGLNDFSVAAYEQIDHNDFANMGSGSAGANGNPGNGYSTTSGYSLGFGMWFQCNAPFSAVVDNNQTYRCGISYLFSNMTGLAILNISDQSPRSGFTFANIGVGSGVYVQGPGSTALPMAIVTNNVSGVLGYSSRDSDYVASGSIVAQEMTGLGYYWFDGSVPMFALQPIGVGARQAQFSVPVTSTSTASFSNFKTPTNASAAGKIIMATSASGDTAWTNNTPTNLGQVYFTIVTNQPTTTPTNWLIDFSKPEVVVDVTNNINVVGSTNWPSSGRATTLYKFRGATTANYLFTVTAAGGLATNGNGSLNNGWHWITNANFAASYGSSLTIYSNKWTMLAVGCDAPGGETNVDAYIVNQQ